MNEYKVAIIGHRDLDYKNYKIAETKLIQLLRTLTDDNCIEVYLGKNGDFDNLAASVIKRMKKEAGDEMIYMTLVLPYQVRDIEFYERSYDRVLIPDSLHGVHPKSAITKRNFWMIEECDLFVCFVTESGGGANRALKYAEKLGKRIVNLSKSSF